MSRRRWTILTRALRMLWRYPLRSGLTLLSGLLGVWGALTSVNYALGGRAKVTDQLTRLGTNLLVVTPTQSRNVGGRARTGTVVTTLTLDDYDAIRREAGMFSRSSGFSVRSYLIKAGDLAKKGCVVVGTEPDYMRIKQWALEEGRGFEASDLRKAARVAVLGASVARELFGESSAIGQRIFINRVPFEVEGVMVERGQSLDAGNEDDQVYVPLTTAMRRLTNADYLSGILFEVNRWDEMDEASKVITTLLSLRHDKSGKLPPDFAVQNQKQLLDTQIAASAKLLFFVRWIGFSALCVSGFGILAIWWIGVRERTREIGTRRAVGATRTDIFLQFIYESWALGLLGCMAGGLVAWESSRFLARWAEQPQVFDRPSAWAAIVVGSLLNVAFAAIPARSAAALDPIQAIRFE